MKEGREEVTVEGQRQLMYSARQSATPKDHDRTSLSAKPDRDAENSWSVTAQARKTRTDQLRG